MTEFCTSMTKESFQYFYRNLSSDTSLMRTLVDMQRGVNERKAFDNAEAIIQAVAAYEGMKASMQDDTRAVVDSFLSESPWLQGENRMLQLHRLHFGLMLHSDAGLLEELKEGANVESLFEKYHAAANQDETVTEETLTDAIRQQMGSLAMSPEVMTAIIRKLEDGKGLLPNAAAVSADGQRFQCILAMQVYLDNQAQGMCPAEAAALACSATDIQQIADAAGRGLITEDQVKFALDLICAVVSLIGLLSVWTFFPTLVSNVISASAGTFLYNNSWAILLVSYLAGMVSDSIAALAGKLSATYHFTHADAHAEMMAGLHHMTDILKEKAGELKNKAAAAVDSLRPAAAEQAEELADEEADPACAF